MGTSVMLQAAGAVLLADFASGLVHWAEDAYARKDTPIVGKWIGEANIEHHIKPRAFVSRSWWASSWDLVLTGVAVVAGAWWLKMLTWHVWLFAVISANANQVCHLAAEVQTDSDPAPPCAPPQRQERLALLLGNQLFKPDSGRTGILETAGAL
jgi:Lipid desaturase domain